MPSNITVIFTDGSRQTYLQVADSYADENPPAKFLALVRSNYPDKKVKKLEKEPTPEYAKPAPDTTSGDKGRWEDLGGGYKRNLDTREIRLK